MPFQECIHIVKVDNFEVTADSPPDDCNTRNIWFSSREVRYLPPYSPDLNPIELAFAKFKKLLRDGARRTVDKLWDLCGALLDEFTEQGCRNYFKHCGYRYT